MPAPRAATNKAASWDEKRAPPGGNAYKDWPTAYQSLLDKGLKAIPPEEAFRMMQKRGALLVDVRPADSTWEKLPLGPFRSGTTITYMTGSAEGAVNVPLFRQIQGNSMFDIIKRLNAWMFLVEPTERNPDFIDLASKLPKNRPIILTCNRGGSLDKGLDKTKSSDKAKMNLPTRYTSSLKAAYELYKLGYKDLYVLEGGINEWEKKGFPMNTDVEDVQPAPVAPA
jgi:rhodanese-related sulfurtransferase